MTTAEELTSSSATGPGSTASSGGAPGQGGAGGAGTTSGTTVTASSTASAGGAAPTTASGTGGAGAGTTSSGSGGATACTAACDKLQDECNSQMGEQICQSGQFDCSNETEQCIADCVNTSPCDEVQACPQKCDTCNAGACGQCAFQSCGAQISACFQNPHCGPWLQCAQECAGACDPSCYTKCNEAHPKAKAFYSAIYDCMCKSCGDACSKEADACNQ